jgi:hypothetical protein
MCHWTRLIFFKRLFIDYYYLLFGDVDDKKHAPGACSPFFSVIDQFYIAARVGSLKYRSP